MARINWIGALKLERDVAILCKEQEDSGIFFKVDEALGFIGLLEWRKSQLYDSIRPYLSYEVKCLENLNKDGDMGCVSKIFLKNGKYNSQVIKHYPDTNLEVIIGGPFSRILIEEPSIGKRAMIINQLLNLGWKPEIFTEKGFPKLTDQGEPVETLLEVGDFGKNLSMWYVYSHRQSQIKGFLKHIRDDGRISAVINTVATNTFRGAHKVVANIPRPTSIFGKEMRSLFSVGEGRAFVGADVAGLELRMLAHRMNDEEYINQILSGDIHTYNQEMAGLHTRDQAKTFIYGFIYGGGDTKIGSIVGGNRSAGTKIKNKFFESIPALKILMDKVKSFAEKRGYVPSVDLRKIFIRKFEGRVLTHTALNAMLQADGSIVTKRAMIIANDEIKKRGLDAFQIIFYHDEMAYDSDIECADEVGKILVDSMRLAGIYYNLNIPIDGTYKVGKDWSIH